MKITAIGPGAFEHEDFVIAEAAITAEFLQTVAKFMGTKYPHPEFAQRSKVQIGLDQNVYDRLLETMGSPLCLVSAWADLGSMTLRFADTDVDLKILRKRKLKIHLDPGKVREDQEIVENLVKQIQEEVLMSNMDLRRYAEPSPEIKGLITPNVVHVPAFTEHRPNYVTCACKECVAKWPGPLCPKTSLYAAICHCEKCREMPGVEDQIPREACIPYAEEAAAPKSLETGQLHVEKFTNSMPDKNEREIAEKLYPSDGTPERPRSELEAKIRPLNHDEMELLDKLRRRLSGVLESWEAALFRHQHAELVDRLFNHYLALRGREDLIP